MCGGKTKNYYRHISQSKIVDPKLGNGGSWRQEGHPVINIQPHLNEEADKFNSLELKSTSTILREREARRKLFELNYYKRHKFVRQYQIFGQRST